VYLYFFQFLDKPAVSAFNAFSAGLRDWLVKYHQL